MALIDITPKMTSDTSPSPYVASASSCSSGHNAYNAFSANINEYWMCNGNGSQWVMIDFSENRKTTGVSVYTTYGQPKSKGLSVYGSLDGIIFDKLLDEQNLQWDNVETKFFEFGRICNYRYYRFNTDDGVKMGEIAGFGRVRLYLDDSLISEPSEDVEIYSKSSTYQLPMNTTQAILTKRNDPREGLLGMANDPENYGDLYVVGKDGKSHLTKSGLKSETIFDGSARGLGNFDLSKSIKNYKLLIVGCSASWGEYVDSFREEIVIDVNKLKYIPFEHIYNVTLTSTQRSMCFYFNRDANTFTINDYIIGNLKYMEINKIVGIY